MTDDLAELVREQKYFDAAWEAREAKRGRLRGVASAGADRKAAAAGKRFALHVDKLLGRPEEPVAFGRALLEAEDGWYIGYNAIWDHAEHILVISWKAPAAAPYFEATYADPQGVAIKRTYSCDGNHIVDFEDVVFAELAAQVEQLEVGEPIHEDALLADLGRKRTARMQDIVRTIQAAQYGIIRSELEQLLIVQGGPGTGKTAVGLHRAAWLLYNYRQRLAANDILIIGPNPTFIRYIRDVLPAISPDDVEQTDIGRLHGGVVAVREESTDAQRLKGDPRMRGLLDKGLRDRIRVLDDPMTVTIGATRAQLSKSEVDSQINRLTRLPYVRGRAELRTYMRQRVMAQTGEADRDGQVEALADRVWPQLTPAAFIQELFGSRDRLLQAAVGLDFSAADIQMLYRQAAPKISEETWSVGDVGLLDYVEEQMNDSPQRTYQHIVVDEAQDLSPMQLLMIRRRSTNGSMSILGDIAQSTGAWARDSWDDVIAFLQRDAPVAIVNLEFGYRVPRQIFEFAAQLLPVAAPSVSPPKVVRDGPSAPTLVQSDELSLGDDAVNATVEYLKQGFNVALICASANVEDITSALKARGVNWADGRKEGLTAPVTVLDPNDARGLEFDAVVVVEPEAIVAEDPRGHRLLYVALTRSTRFLTVVHARGALPLRGAEPSQTASQPAAKPTPRAVTDRKSRFARALGEVLAEEIRESLDPELWDAVLEELMERLYQEPPNGK